jgi:hypothetical protein
VRAAQRSDGAAPFMPSIVHHAQRIVVGALEPSFYDEL